MYQLSNPPVKILFFRIFRSISRRATLNSYTALFNNIWSKQIDLNAPIQSEKHIQNNIDRIKQDLIGYFKNLMNIKERSRIDVKKVSIMTSIRRPEERLEKQKEQQDDENSSNSSQKSKEAENSADLRQKESSESKQKFETSQQNNGNNNKNFPPEKIPGQDFFLYNLGLVFFVLAYLLSNISQWNLSQEITWQKFRNDLLQKGFVAKLTVVNKLYVYVTLNENGMNASHNNNNRNYYFTIGSVNSFERKLNSAQEELGIDEEFRIPIEYITKDNKLSVQILSALVFVGGIFWLNRRTGSQGPNAEIFKYGKSKARKFNKLTDIKVNFNDVAGCDEAKVEIMEFVSFLKQPSRYEKMGAKIPRGAILSGPPGTGKTLLAKATAGEAGVPFYSVSGSEFIEMFVGVGSARVRDLFKTARENAPSIVFVDEIDAIGKARQKSNISSANDERENTLNQLLIEMDGFEPTDHVVVLAGTNRADVLDQALLRPGRFDRHINIDKPELEGRKGIFQVHLSKITLAGEIKTLKNILAALTPGFSGADIANVCNEAALIAARNNNKNVRLEHFEQAIERVIGGVERKSKLLSPSEKKIVAYHEAGHAICGWFLEFADPLLKVSIIPRGQAALGYAQYLPPDIYLMNEQQLKDRITMTLGGRVSEELNFSSITSGASDDFKKVTRMATAMVTELGMSNKIGWVNYAKKSQDDLTKPFSEGTAAIIDSEVYRIIHECHQRCITLLKEKTKELESIAQFLLKKEVLTRDDMILLLGKRPFPERNNVFENYLNESETTKLHEQEIKNSPDKDSLNENPNNEEKKQNEGPTKQCNDPDIF